MSPEKRKTGFGAKKKDPCVVSEALIGHLACRDRLLPHRRPNMKPFPQFTINSMFHRWILALVLCLSSLGLLEAADGHIEITLDKPYYIVGDVIRGTATAVPDNDGYSQPNIDGTITVSVNPSLINEAPPVYNLRSTSFSFKADKVADYAITASSTNSSVTPGRKIVFVFGALDLTASTTVVDYGSIKLGDIDTAKLVEIRTKTDALATELTAIASDGEVSPAERPRIIVIKNELRAIRSQLQSLTLPTTTGSGTSPAGAITIQVTGTSGQPVTLTLTDAFVSAKYGTGYGDKLGTLSQTTGVIPFSVTFTPSGNYGTATIEGKLDNSSALTDSVAITIKGQSEESARQLENTRHAARLDEIEFFNISMGIIYGALGGAASILLIGATGFILIFGILTIAITVAGMVLVTTLICRQKKAEEDAIHRGNLSIIELLPEVDPPAGTENNTDAP